MGFVYNPHGASGLTRPDGIDASALALEIRAHHRFPVENIIKPCEARNKKRDQGAEPRPGKTEATDEGHGPSEYFRRKWMVKMSNITRNVRLKRQREFFRKVAKKVLEEWKPFAEGAAKFHEGRVLTSIEAKVPSQILVVGRRFLNVTLPKSVIENFLGPARLRISYSSKLVLCYPLFETAYPAGPFEELVHLAGGIPQPGFEFRGDHDSAGSPLPAVGR